MSDLEVQQLLIVVHLPLGYGLVFAAEPTRPTQHCELLGLVRVVISGSRTLSLSKVFLVFSEVAQAALSKEVDYDSGMFTAVFHSVNVRLLNRPPQLDYKGFLI